MFKMIGRKEAARAAASAGIPAAVRAVSSTCATNLMPIVIPGHRVVRIDGMIGQNLSGMVATHR